MGKKRIATKKGGGMDSGLKSRALSKVPKKRIEQGTLFIQASFNNTKAHVADKQGNVAVWATSGALGFKGARKGTPYAAAKVGEILGEKAAMMNMKEVDAVVKGIGAGRESLLRSFAAQGIQITEIKDHTPIPFNGPKPPKPRRV
jgi:small subunit ribosomal protein S11